MNKLELSYNKTLKLTNVLKCKVLMTEESINPNIIIEQMQSYIKSKGALQIGPLIQYTETLLNENGEPNIELFLMFQCNCFINKVEQPYSMESVIRVSNTLYCRYIGAESTLRFAYDKINLEAFEKDISLENCSYTIFVDNNEDEQTIIADVFIPRKGTQ